jgi:hypothetical protein
MTTRLDLRLALRRTLEDTGVNPLWDDVLLNDMIWNSLVRFSVRVPLEAAASVSIAPTVTTIPVAPALIRDRVLRVIDARREIVPEAVSLGPGGPGEARAWRWWNGSLVLNRALGTAETWTVEYRAVRAMPADDAAPIQIEPGDEPILVAMAAEAVLRRRAVEEMKRNGVARIPLVLAEAMMAEADRLLKDRRRTVRSGVLAVR